jgi:formamidase
MTRHTLTVDRTVSLQADHTNSHNRWHPGIEPSLEIDPGDEVVFECRDGFDGQIRDGATAEDLGRLELGREPQASRSRARARTGTWTCYSPSTEHSNS